MNEIPHVIGASLHDDPTDSYRVTRYDQHAYLISRPSLIYELTSMFSEVEMLDLSCEYRRAEYELYSQREKGLVHEQTNRPIGGTSTHELGTGKRGDASTVKLSAGWRCYDLAAAVRTQLLL